MRTVSQAATRQYVFAGGGTGGHLFPGIAVAEELLRRDGNARIVFTGSQRALEREILSGYGFEHRSLTAEPSTMLRRHPVRFAWRNLRAYRQTKKLLAAERPNAVVGLGGFASIPVVMAARSFGIPRLLLEQNVIPGRANRWLQKRASWICYAFEQTVGVQSIAHCSVTGNPVRREIAALVDSEQASNQRPTLLVLGGSQGAVGLNDVMMAAIERLKTSLADWQIVHQTGRQQVASVRDRYAKLALEARVEPFLENLSEWYRAATLAVSRAGGTTLAELACAGLPAILIPYPHALDAHQLRNAEAYEHAGAAQIVEQTSDLTAACERFVAVLARLIESEQERMSMRQAMRKLARPNAAVAVADRLEQFVALAAAS